MWQAGQPKSDSKGLPLQRQKRGLQYPNHKQPHNQTIQGTNRSGLEVGVGAPRFLFTALQAFHYHVQAAQTYTTGVVGCARFIDQKVYKLVTNFQTSLEQNIVSGAAPLWINNAPVHVSQTYPSLVWSPEPRYIHRGHVNQADTGSKMTIWVSWAYGHQIMRIRIRQKRFEILKVHIKLFRLRQQFSFVRRPEHGRIGV